MKHKQHREYISLQIITVGKLIKLGRYMKYQSIVNASIKFGRINSQIEIPQTSYDYELDQAE